jgi:hypothetical protein
LFAVLALASCATTQLDAQWANPDYKGRSLRGAPVLVACEAQDLTLQRVCEDRLSAELAALGGSATRSTQLQAAASAPNGGNDPYVAAAKRINARAIVRTTLTVGAVAAQPGPQIGIGVGGGSGGYGGGWGGGFGGISFPVGGARVTNAYTGETAVIDPANGAIMWSGRATSPANSDLAQQVAEIAKTTAGALQQAGLF